MKLHVILAIVALVGGCICLGWGVVQFSSKDMFTSDVRAFLAADADGLVAGFSDADLRARGAGSRAEYVARSASSVRSPTERERARLPEEARASAVVVTDDRYEGGLPHTRGAFMFLPADLFAASELDAVVAHELVHLRQRARPDEARAWAAAHGYRPSARQERVPRERANPDLDGVAWDGPDGRRVAFAYSGEAPRDLHDGRVVGGTGYEHPYEHQAYA